MSKKHRRALIRMRRTAPGTAPGTLIPDLEAPHPVIRLTAYSPEAMEEREVQDPDQVREYLEKWPVVWVDVAGLGDLKVIQRLGEIFQLHILALEDVVNVHQRPKVEEYPAHLFVVTRVPWLLEHLVIEQVSLFVGRNFVLTFQERLEDCLAPVREHLRKGIGRRIRNDGPGYLAYAIADTVVDHFFPVLERYGEHLEGLEDQVLKAPIEANISRVLDVKQDLLALRRAIWPLREALSAAYREEESPWFSPETRIFLRDSYDHTVQIIDVVETYRDLASELTSVYLSSLSNRMNEAMKVLTVIATIFIPLGFVAGLYGMNFRPEVSPFNMPELNWRWGYLFSLVLMGIIAGALLLYFWRKGWIGSRQPRNNPGPPSGAESRRR